jgi:2-isopropylmalate synthase
VKQMKNSKKYTARPVMDMPERRWPSKKVNKAPVWCSVDLRDGNQALSEPMDLPGKLEFFRLLTSIGFKEIEVGFPSSSETEYETVRTLIEDGLVPDDVTLQVLVQSKENLINRTFDAIRGAKNVIVHLYTGISRSQQKIVFGMSDDELISLAVSGAQQIKKLGDEYKRSGMNIRYEYSPEGFSDADPAFAVRICCAVADAFDDDKDLIINLPSSVERTMPNVYADMVEYFIGNFEHKGTVISIHPHNDRGTAVASAELGLLAGASRIEGTLFGNGERTGNVDIITLALNMYSQGIDPGLDLSDIKNIRRIYERITGMHVPERQPYSGDLVFTAFSGSHQDAISKGKKYMKASESGKWEVPYLPIDPSDIGRAYEPIIRINSQSGKGGAAYIMSEVYGYHLPKAMYAEFGELIKRCCDQSKTEATSKDIFDAFSHEYLEVSGPYVLTEHKMTESGSDEGEHRTVTFTGKLSYKGDAPKNIRGTGNGPIDAFFNAISKVGISGYHFVDYSEHAISLGSDAQAVSYIHLADDYGKSIFGVGVSHNINYASIKGVLCAINRSLKENGEQ